MPETEQGAATAEAAARFLAANRAKGVPTAAFIGDPTPASTPLRTVEVPLPEREEATEPAAGVPEHLEIDDFDKTVDVRIARRRKPPLDVTIEPMHIRKIRRLMWLNARIAKFQAEAAATDDPDEAERLMALVDRYEEETIRLAIPSLPEGFTAEVTMETIGKLRQTINDLSQEQLGATAQAPLPAAASEPSPGSDSRPPSSPPSPATPSSG